MRSILSEDDLAAALGADQAAIYFFVLRLAAAMVRSVG